MHTLNVDAEAGGVSQSDLALSGASTNKISVESAAPSQVVFQGTG